MAVYWTLELLPLPVTSLLPVVLFPLLGVADTNSTAMVYMKVAVATMMNIYLLLNSVTNVATQCCPHTGGADDVHRKLDGRLGRGGEWPSQEDCPQRTQSRGEKIKKRPFFKVVDNLRRISKTRGKEMCMLPLLTIS